MPRTRRALVLAFALAACEETGPPCGDDTASPDAASDCVPVTATSETWVEQGRIEAPFSTRRHPVAPPATAGEGLIHATLTFGAYGGEPRLDLWNRAGDEIVASGIAVPDAPPEVTLTWEMTVDQVAQLDVAEFLPADDRDAYPVDYTLTLTWIPTPDCWEANDTREDAARLPVGEVHEAWLSGAISDSTLRDVDDDWYRVDLPDDATGLAVDLTFPADGIIPLVEVYDRPAATEPIQSVSAYYPDGIALRLDADATGTVWLRVSDRYGVEYAYGGPFDPSGTPRPAHFDAPYTLAVTPR